MTNFIFWFVLWFLFGMLVTAFRSYIRAVHNKPYGIKHGMVLSKKTNKLIGTETVVMTDPVSGSRWYGETRVIEEQDTQ